MYNQTFEYDVLTGKYRKPKPKNDPTDILNGHCDWKAYAVRYPDLMDTIGPKTEFMKEHYNKEGRKQGRDCSHDPNVWDCKEYMQRYYWLNFGYDCDAAFQHYVNEGRFGERNPGKEDCYELYNGNLWLRALDRNPKNVCQAFDSCKPGGGNVNRDKHRCFKWASGPEEKGDRWNGNYLISKPGGVDCLVSALDLPKIEQTMCNPRDKEQQFTIKFIDDDNFLLNRTDTEQCINTGGGNRFHLTKCDANDNNQVFSIAYADPYTAIKSNANNKCIDDRNNQVFGREFKLTDCINRNSGQHFEFIPIQKGDMTW